MNALLLTLALVGHTEVTPTAILGHGDPTPRFSAHYPNTLIIPAGQTVTLPPDSTYDAVEVSGTLLASTDHDTVCRTIHLTVMPGGTLDLDTPKRCEIVFRDVPLRTGTVQAPDIDPHQIGNGLIVFGTFRVRGHQLDSPFTQLTAEAQAGATTIQFAVPGGWQVGDELLLPDMRQPASNIPSRRESPVTIAAIDGDKVTLSKPLDFEHLAVKRPDGSVVCLPYVANITRNIVFRSENPAGTRGHVIFLEQAKVDVQYAAFIGMGRTQAVNLDSTSLTGSADDRIGTNQIARYGASHWHHVHGHADIDGLTGRYVGVYADGTDGAKWGFVQHGSHDIEHRDCIADRFIGAGFITEDGYEVRGKWTNNLGCYSKGNGIDGKFNLVPPRNIPGGEGAAFWFHGMGQQEIRGNVAMCSAVGYQFFYRNQVLGRSVPSVPGGANDTPIDPRKAVPITEDNFAFGNRTGFESWNNPAFTYTRCVSGYNEVGIKAGNGEPGSVTTKDTVIVGFNGTGTGVSSSAAYTNSLSLTGGEIVGCDVGVHEARSFVDLIDLTMQCKTNINYHFFRPERSLFQNVVHRPLGSNPKRFFVMGQGQDWQPGQPIPRYGAAWVPAIGKKYVSVGGTFGDCLLFENQQRRSKPAWYSANQDHFYSPVAGITMGECWDRFGIAYGGGVIADADAVPIDGVIFGVSKPGLDYPLGPPRATLVSPHQHSEAKQFGQPVTDRLDFHFYLGGADNSGGRSRFAVDDGQPITVGPYFNPWHGIYRATGVGNTPGTHTVKTWREDASGNKITGSDLAFSYFIGQPTPPPDPDPEPDPDPDPQPDPSIAQLVARIEQLEREVLSLLERIVELENFRRDVKAAGE